MTRTAVLVAAAATVLATVTAGWAASFALATAHLGGAGLTTPVMYPYFVTTSNGSGRASPGHLDKNDTLSVVWSRPIDPPTLCSGLPNNTTTVTFTMTWVIQNDTGTSGNDVLVPAPIAGCSSGMHVGAVDLGSPGYITGSNGTFASASTTLSVGATITSPFRVRPRAVPPARSPRDRLRCGPLTRRCSTWPVTAAATTWPRPQRRCSSDGLHRANR